MSHLRPQDLVLAPAAVLYGLGVSLRTSFYRAGIFRTQRLDGRVISVGNLTVGGTGKTPAVIALAKLLRAPGRRIGILTRGYRRQTRETFVLNGTGAEWKSLVEGAGDEPVLLARHLPDTPIGVAADRFEAGQRLEREHGVNLFLLDDGFQHWALARDVDIVLVDATAADDGLLPRGRRREPWAALARAQIVIITRIEQADPTPSIRRVRSANPRVAIFCAKTALESARDAASDAVVAMESLRGKRSFAFCGLGNHRAFLENLAHWGFTVEGSRAFRDHHRYRERDLEELLRAARESRAEVLVTTEKDILNWQLARPAPAPIYYSRIALEFDQPERLVAEIERVLASAA